MTPQECLGCARLSACTETSSKKVYEHYVCPAYAAVADPVYAARWNMVTNFGLAGVKAMMEEHGQEEEER